MRSVRSRSAFLFSSLAVVASSAFAANTARVSLNSAGVEGDSASDNASISTSGRYVAFQSYASNLVNGDVNGSPGVNDIFLRDLKLGTTVLISVHTDGTQSDGYSAFPVVN